MPPKAPTLSDPSVKADALLRTLEDIEPNILGISNVDEEHLSGRTLIRFESQLTNAEANWVNFQSAWQQRIQIQVLLEGEESFPTDNWKQRYNALQEEIIEARTILRVAQLACTPEQSVKGTANTTLNATNSNSPKSQLPRIHIPTFSGDILKWPHFRDTFASMVHEEPNLSNVERFHHLISALKGEAAALISRFTIEDKSYKLAWEKVVETYDNPRVLASMHIHRILDCNIKSTKSEIQKYDEFLTNVADSVHAFRVLKLENPEEFLLSTLALRALDPETRTRFEMSIKSSKALPTTDDVIDFVRERRTALQMSNGLTSNSSSETSFSSRSSKYPNRRATKYQPIALHSTSASAASKNQTEVPRHVQPPKNQRSTVKPSTRDNSISKGGQPASCPFCQEAHNLSYCKGFKEAPAKKRCELVKTFHVCWNCLRKGHRVTECSSKFRCRDCNKKHHTLIHSEFRAPEKAEDDQHGRVEQETFIGFGSTPGMTVSTPRSVLLSTVQVLVRGPGGELSSARGVLDSGSQQTFISNALASKLKTKVTPYKGSITGIGEAAVPKAQLKGSIACIVQSLKGSHEYKVNPIIVDRITSVLPSLKIPTDVAGKFLHLPLADREFANPGPVDLLIGGDLYPQVITGAPYHSDVHDLYLTPTVFGLVISGKLDTLDHSASFSFFTESRLDIDTQLKKFWELEEPKAADRTDPQEQFCEEHFLRTHSRNAEGRYIARLPFKSEISAVGRNRDVAYRRFYSLEQRFNRDSTLAERYTDFMKEYIQLNHMSPTLDQVPYLIPHHGVWQDGPQGRKLRVVLTLLATLRSKVSMMLFLLVHNSKLTCATFSSSFGSTSFLSVRIW